MKTKNNKKKEENMFLLLRLSYTSRTLFECFASLFCFILVCLRPTYRRRRKFTFHFFIFKNYFRRIYKQILRIIYI